MKFIAKSLDTMSQGFHRLGVELKALLILKGITWTIITIGLAFCGSWLSKLWVIDDILLMFGLLSSYLVLKNSDTRAELFAYYNAVNRTIKRLILDEDSEPVTADNSTITIGSMEKDGSLKIEDLNPCFEVDSGISVSASDVLVG